MSNEIVPLLNAQQQGMATTIGNIANRVEVMSQASQFVASQVVAEENKKLDEVAEDAQSSLVSRDGGSHAEYYNNSSNKEKKEDENLEKETNPSYHNPLAGKLLNKRV